MTIEALNKLMSVFRMKIHAAVLTVEDGEATFRWATKEDWASHELSRCFEGASKCDGCSRQMEGGRWHCFVLNLNDGWGDHIFTVFLCDECAELALKLLTDTKVGD